MTAEVLYKVSELITTALGLVAAMAWNEAIQQLFTQLFGEAGGALATKFGYAVIITLVVIFATISVSRAAERAKKLEGIAFAPLPLECPPLAEWPTRRRVTWH